jgi:hypothetical protein
MRQTGKRIEILSGIETTTVDGIDLTLFAPGTTTSALHQDRYDEVPTTRGVYVVLRDSAEKHEFLATSGAGWFKNRDPSYPENIVNAAWVEGARVMYIGKAEGARGLRQRIRQLVEFGFGKQIGHRGGRMLWHLKDYASLLIRWYECEDADAMETLLISQFKSVYDDARPFANRLK